MLASASLASISIAGVYQVTDFSGFHAIVYPHRFYHHGYDATLTDLIAQLLELEILGEFAKGCKGPPLVVVPWSSQNIVLS